ncbi:hypothetical protein DUI87_05822 [Hirundo rustica rustica]|uniref:Uncharacterized protein n=1 Tax=Hirundo rustica rustica TaxID=333673 RepID=A0A3M0L0F1_HIRRU|nr:hypothetical protein DUI87_05822 [Hirundo rustica rustica]
MGLYELHAGRYRQGNEGIENSLAKKDLGPLMDDKLDTSQQCALGPECQSPPWLHPNPSGHWGQGGDSALVLHTCETPSAELHPALGSSAQEGMDLLEPVTGWRRDTKMIRMEPLTYEDRLRDLEPIGEKKKASFMQADSDRTVWNALEWKEVKFRLYIRKKFFTVRVMRV